MTTVYSDIWTWEKCKKRISSLKGRLGFAESSSLKFLKLTLSLENGQIHDELRNKRFPEIEPNVYCILSGYAEAKPVSETSKLISYSHLSGGQNYYNAFIRRAVQPIEKTFGSYVEKLWEAAKLLDSEKLSHADCSVKVYALPLVPIVVLLYGASSEFSASANMLFDSSANNYLSTEQLAMLGELTSTRLKQAYEANNLKQK
jgi:hypothetical protein